VIRTRVGYAGGTSDNPTYHRLGDHSETIQIDYDPTVISYRELLEVFWRSHDPAGQSWSRQYMTAVFYHNEDQKRLAEETRDQVARMLGQKIETRILPLTGFHRAEDYHQKYYLRGVPDLAGELLAVYPNLNDFVNSTAAARLNGYVSGCGSRAQLDREIDGLGLSDRGKERLRGIVGGR